MVVEGKNTCRRFLCRPLYGVSPRFLSALGGSRNNPDQSFMLCQLYPLVEHPLSADYGPLYFGLNIYRVVRKQGSFLYGTIHGIQKHEDDLEH